MKTYYPIMLDLEGKPCCVVGGGRVAERKARGLLQAGAAVTMISPAFTPELDRLAAAGDVRAIRRPYAPGMAEVRSAQLLFAATNDAAVNALVCEEGRSLGIWVNGAGDTDHGDFILPATARRGRLTVAVSTAGASPGLSRFVRTDIERRLDQDGYAPYVELLHELRHTLQELVADSGERQAMFRAMLQWELLPRLRGETEVPAGLRQMLLHEVRQHPTLSGIRRIGESLLRLDEGT
ncbi:bifunctional precorrin-2 dehydrogenase/sirohydrochlorin ferrochelatase [Paenibacillus validus]|uniref:precorrin-2 dehydrogenase n=1 Tax=Paenibacillus validus TaxID=44253 RepID=A0A7X3CPZ0_9BACL|nr:bifunctional precorrin-2 dehydrogenase/sirohydrochlorin ferrochelatase [Paenibacillus validus]MUG69100.1 bifunctional precorrin-2 dehydrogenase/sirohydrochlorin ferrochelatase [Paenibacillus validus]